MVAARRVPGKALLRPSLLLVVIALLTCGFRAPVIQAAGETGQPSASLGVDAGAGAGESDALAEAVAYMEMGAFGRAVEVLSRAIEADTDGRRSCSALDMLGYIYWCRGSYEDALQAFTASLDRADGRRERFRAMAGAGQALLDAGRTDEACRQFEAALANAEPPLVDVAYTLLGIAKLEAGDRAGAAEMFLRALDAFPENPVAAEYLGGLSFGLPVHFGSVSDALAGIRGTEEAPRVEDDASPASDAPGADVVLPQLRGVAVVDKGASYVRVPQVSLTVGVDPPSHVEGFFLAVGDALDGGPYRWHDWRSPVVGWCLRDGGEGRKQAKVVYYVTVPKAADVPEVSWVPEGHPASGTDTSGAPVDLRGADVRDHVRVVLAESRFVLDREPPWGIVEINGGARAVNSTRVTLSMSANDRVSGILGVSVSNDGMTWSPWAMYQFTQEWVIPAGDGAKRVYVRFQDKAGNVSLPVSAGITLDTVPPKLSLIEVIHTGETTAEIVWVTDEDSDSAVEYAADEDANEKWARARDADMTVLHVMTLKGLRPATTYRLRVLSKDEAGNVASSRVLEFTTRAAREP